MAALIQRVCYATREEVRRAVDNKLAAYNDRRIDRAIQSGADFIDKNLCHRKFYFEDTTKFWDWPNYQYAYPWRVWFDADELADVTVNPPVVISGGVLIPNSAIFWGDPNYPNAPYRYMELDRSQSYSFGNGPTPQREISIQGTFGHDINTAEAGTVAADIGEDDTTITVSEGDTPGVGDMIIIDSERMICVDSTFTDSGGQLASGGTTALPSDNLLTFTDFEPTAGEVIMVDQEWMLVQGVYGSNVVVQRAWSGSILKTHSASAEVWARRLLTVLRGQLGTTAATHDSGTVININAPPGLVKQLNVAEAIVALTNEPGAFAQGAATNSGAGTTYRSTGGVSFGTAVREPMPGPGLPTLRDDVYQAFGRKVRSRVI